MNEHNKDYPDFEQQAINFWKGKVYFNSDSETVIRELAKHFRHFYLKGIRDSHTGVTT